MKMQSVRFARRGFTLLELLVVVAILAIIASVALVTYDGLQGRSANSASAYNINAIDRTLRQYAAVNNTLPDRWDTLLFSATGTGADGVLLDFLAHDLEEKLAPWSLPAGAATALSGAGLGNLLYANGDEDYNAVLGDLENDHDHAPAAPSHVFDLPSGGWGIQVPTATGLQVARVIDVNFLRNALGYDVAPGEEAALIAGTDGEYPLVLAFGFGGRNTAVKSHSAIGMSEAPVDGGVAPNQYGRFVVLVHIGDWHGNHGHFHNAHVVGVLDARGNHLSAAQALAAGGAGDHDH